MKFNMIRKVKAMMKCYRHFLQAVNILILPYCFTAFMQYHHAWYRKYISFQSRNDLPTNDYLSNLFSSHSII